MIRINLLPVKELKAEVARRRELRIAGASVGVTVLLLLAVHQYQTYRISSLEKDVTELRKEIQVLNTKAKEVAELEAKRKEYEGKHKIIVDLNKKKVGPVGVMESLSATTPPSLWLTGFRESGGSLTITGMAVDNQTVADFLRALSTSTYFKNVELVETTHSEKDNPQLKKFAIRSTISYQPPAAAGTQSKPAPPSNTGSKG